MQKTLQRFEGKHPCLNFLEEMIGYFILHLVICNFYKFIFDRSLLLAFRRGRHFAVCHKEQESHRRAFIDHPEQNEILCHQIHFFNKQCFLCGVFSFNEDALNQATVFISVNCLLVAECEICPQHMNRSIFFNNIGYPIV